MQRTQLPMMHVVTPQCAEGVRGVALGKLMNRRVDIKLTRDPTLAPFTPSAGDPYLVPSFIADTWT